MPCLLSPQNHYVYQTLILLNTLRVLIKISSSFRWHLLTVSTSQKLHVVVQPPPQSSSLPRGWRCWREKFLCWELSVDQDAVERAQPWVSTVEQWKQGSKLYILYELLIFRFHFLLFAYGSRKVLHMWQMNKKKTSTIGKTSRKNCLYNEWSGDRRQQNIDAGGRLYSAPQPRSKRCGETFATGKNSVHYSGDAAIIIWGDWNGQSYRIYYG